MPRRSALAVSKYVDPWSPAKGLRFIFAAVGEVGADVGDEGRRGGVGPFEEDRDRVGGDVPQGVEVMAAEDLVAGDVLAVRCVAMQEVGDQAGDVVPPRRADAVNVLESVVAEAWRLAAGVAVVAFRDGGEERGVAAADDVGGV